ncbi:hypothetical protein [Egbenema bharatensis]|uniref:hypothetical protein n=1 Tax=Egbenema bharatensis TaxID=3463334 RepID=UPI003A858F41
MAPIYLRVLIPCWILEQAELGSIEYQQDLCAYCGLDESILTLPNLPPIGTSITVKTATGDIPLKVVHLKLETQTNLIGADLGVVFAVPEDCF